MTPEVPSSIFHLTNQEIYVITTAHAGKLSGQIATWVMLATLIPEQLRVLTAISPLNFTWTQIEATQQFVINLLATGQEDWVPLFGLQSSREINKFANIPVTYTAKGIPILPNTCGWAECQVGHQLDTGDRTLYIADVLAHQVDPSREPLRVIPAFAALPANQVRALNQKRHQDIESSRSLIKPLRAVSVPEAAH